MGVIASQITSLTIVCSTVYSDADQRKHRSSASLAFVWGIHRDRWIPRTKVQLRGKCFHFMTSSWFCYISSAAAGICLTRETWIEFLLTFSEALSCCVVRTYKKLWFMPPIPTNINIQSSTDPIYHDITYGTATTAAESESDYRITTLTPYLGKLWGVCCEEFGENWPCCNGTVLYFELVNSLAPEAPYISREPGQH